MKTAAVKKEKKETWVNKFLKRPDSSAIVAVALLVIFFALFTDNFLTKQNIFGLLRSSALYIFIAIGMASVLCVGGMNISIGATGSLCTVVAGVCFQNLGLPIWAAVLVTLLAGVLTGLVNGLVITKLRINAFVTTLSTMFVYQGLANGISKGYPYSDIPDSFTWLGRGSVGDLIPYLFILAAIFLVLLHVYYKYTVLGRQILATGGNLEAARMLGVKTDQTIIIANITSNVFAALAALLWLSRLGSGTVATGGDWMLIGNAVAIIGGTALSGGVISSVGLLCAGIMLAIIKNGLIMIGVNVYYEQTFLGILILIAVAMDSIRSGVAKKSK